MNLSLKKDLVANLLDKDLKTTILKMLRELKKLEKLKEIMYEQNGSINKRRESLKRKKTSGA